MTLDDLIEASEGTEPEDAEAWNYFAITHGLALLEIARVAREVCESAKRHDGIHHMALEQALEALEAVK